MELGKINKKDKAGQQEIIGFVLIVVLVLVAGMVFLIIAIKSPIEEKESKNVENLLFALEEHTTDCANYEPNYYSIKKLVKECYGNHRCENLDRESCDYLEEEVKEILDKVIETEAGRNFYELEIFFRDSDEDESSDVSANEDEILSVFSGECNISKSSSAQIASPVAFESGNIITRLRIC